MSQRLIQNSVSRSWNIKPLSNWRPFVSLYLVQWGFWYMWFQYATITEIYRKRRKEFSPYLHNAEWIQCAWAAQKYISHLAKFPFRWIICNVLIKFVVFFCHEIYSQTPFNNNHRNGKPCARHRNKRNEKANFYFMDCYFYCAQ